VPGCCEYGNKLWVPETEGNLLSNELLTGKAAAYLFEVISCKPEGRGFDCRRDN
jgi:hypothetical protein